MRSEVIRRLDSRHYLNQPDLSNALPCVTVAANYQITLSMKAGEMSSTKAEGFQGLREETDISSASSFRQPFANLRSCALSRLTLGLQYSPHSLTSDRKLAAAARQVSVDVLEAQYWTSHRGKICRRQGQRFQTYARAVDYRTMFRRLKSFLGFGHGRSRWEDQLQGAPPRSDSELAEDARQTLLSRFKQCRALAKDLPTSFQTIFRKIGMKKDGTAIGGLIKALERGSEMTISKTIDCKCSLLFHCSTLPLGLIPVA